MLLLCDSTSQVWQSLEQSSDGQAPILEGVRLSVPVTSAWKAMKHLPSGQILDRSAQMLLPLVQLRVCDFSPAVNWGHPSSLTLIWPPYWARARPKKRTVEARVVFILNVSAWFWCMWEGANDIGWGLEEWFVELRWYCFRSSISRYIYTDILAV